MPLEEKIEILVVLCADDDAAIRDTAFKTLQGWDAEELGQMLSNPATPLHLLEFGVNYLAPGRKDVQESLLKNPQLPGDLRTWVESLPTRPEAGEGLDAEPAAAAPAAPEEGGEKKDARRETLIQRISRLSTAEKIKTSLTGSQEERLALIHDSNRLVARAVLQSPKLSPQEVENICTMKNVTEEVLRMIASNRKFIKSYNVALSLVNNPRAPLDVTMPLMNRLHDRDLKNMAQNKNVADTLRTQAQKLIRQKIDSQRVKLPIKGKI